MRSIFFILFIVLGACSEPMPARQGAVNPAEELTAEIETDISETDRLRAQLNVAREVLASA